MLDESSNLESSISPQKKREQDPIENMSSLQMDDNEDMLRIRSTAVPGEESAQKFIQNNDIKEQ